MSVLGIFGLGPVESVTSGRSGNGETEPPSDWRLVEDSRVIASPHIGGFTEESVGRAISGAVDGILQVLEKGAE